MTNIEQELIEAAVIEHDAHQRKSRTTSKKTPCHCNLCRTVKLYNKEQT